MSQSTRELDTTYTQYFRPLAPKSSATQLTEDQQECPSQVPVRQACQRCRKQRAKCDGQNPCYRCQQASRNCIYVMIDGNGLLFRDEWIEKGAEGGRRGARVLREAIIAQCCEHSDVEIIAKVVTNTGGLARTLGHDVFRLRDFALGFTQGGSGFDFIDVGLYEGCLSYKITENIRFHLENYNCRHILMGISHDPSYATFLNKVSQDEFCRRRITIIEGTPTVPELIATNIPSLDLGRQLFCSATYFSEKGPYDLCPRSSTQGLQPVSPDTNIAPVNKPGCSSLSYADAASSGSPPRQISFLTPPNPITSWVSGRQNLDTPSEQVDWNPGPRGMDAPIHASIFVMDSIKNRRDSEKLCNIHFLRGPCTKGDLCPFVHDYSPSSEEIDAIAVLARQRPCKNG